MSRESLRAIYAQEGRGYPEAEEYLLRISLKNRYLCDKSYFCGKFQTRPLMRNMLLIPYPIDFNMGGLRAFDERAG